METEKIVPADALNLELKYLDENVRPFLLAMEEAYVAHLSGAPGLQIIYQGLAAINASIVVNRLTPIEIKELRMGFKVAKEDINNRAKFRDSIVSAMDALRWKIADVRMFSRPAEGTRKSSFGTALEKIIELEKEKIKKEKEENNGIGN